jgi:hypothetical protein
MLCICIGCAILLSSITYKLEKLEITLFIIDGNAWKNKVRGTLMDNIGKNPTT